ncbi:uncharacterized protein [Centruroides vittatus]|uniref:uncharacterized protein isoform X2 n=1 Tax=Centruroides vittatus TaxID=120091 RepID=UPI0035109876
MGNQQMTYSTNPRDGSYADTRMLYESGNYGSNHPPDDSNMIVRNIVEEIIDSACERSDPISDGAKLAPDGDQAPFSDQVEYSRGNPHSVNYLESEETDSLSIQNILESSKYEPFKSSNEDVFVDSVEGQYHPYSLVKPDHSNDNIENNCSKGEDFAIASVNRHNSDCLDSKYFKDNLTSNNENSKNSSFDQFKRIPKEITAEQKEPSAENIIVEDSKYVNIENDSITNEKFIYTNISKDNITPSVEKFRSFE